MNPAVVSQCGYCHSLLQSPAEDFYVCFNFVLLVSEKSLDLCNGLSLNPYIFMG